LQASSRTCPPIRFTKHGLLPELLQTVASHPKRKRAVFVEISVGMWPEGVRPSGIDILLLTTASIRWTATQRMQSVAIWRLVTRMGWLR
jgi:hypothetical protein